MSAEQVARLHYSARGALIGALASIARRLWRAVDPARIAESWTGQLPELVTMTSATQVAAARGADGYLDAVLVEQGISPGREGRLNVSSLSGIASDGRDLASLLYRPAVTTLAAIQSGTEVDDALASGYATLEMIVGTQVADAGRVADQVALTVRPAARGYVRMLVGGSCSRCVVLAGRRYEWNKGFDRHPMCNCVHVPAGEDTADDIRTDPMAYFRSLTEAEQDKAFTRAGAESIRLGADISQVVSARRGALGLTPASARLTVEEARTLRGGRTRGHLERTDVFGRQLYVTTDGVTVRGRAGVRLGARETGVRRAGDRYRSARPPRLMPESILEIANGDREEAVRLLRRFGYIT